MYRKPRHRGDADILDLDSLMDILSCLVGVMLFLVIYTVLELGSVTYEASIPVVRQAPPGSERVVVMVDQGMVRVLDARGPIEQLTSGFEIVRYEEVPAFVADVNARAPADWHFFYSLVFDNRISAFGNPIGAIDLLVEERPGVVGDSIHQIDSNSRFAAALGALDPAEVWLSFAVDTESVEVFRVAREFASARGFATRWDPVSVDFPVTHILAEGGAEILLTPRSTLTKPDR